MKTTRYESREEWLKARKGKITGTKLKDIHVARGTNEKVGFYELIAEQLLKSEDALTAEDAMLEDENAMARGHRLEEVAIEEFEKVKQTLVVTDLVIWEHETIKGMAISPDGWMGDDAHEAVEVKCLSSARHIEAVITDQVPKEFKYQMLQYFAVNDGLEKLHFVFFDPRLSVHALHIIEIERESVIDEVKEVVEYQKERLKRIKGFIKQLLK